MLDKVGLEIVHVGGPTVVLRLGGLKILSDPTFDPPGEYPIGSRSLTKLGGPAVPAAELGPYDVVLVSHDQHPDNLDRSGAELLPDVETVLSTPEAAGRLPGVIGLSPYESFEMLRPDGGALVVTAVPARHGPVGCEGLTGTVTGFVLAGPGLPTVYVSGDNAAVDLVEEALSRLGAVDLAQAAETAGLGHRCAQLPLGEWVAVA